MEEVAYTQFYFDISGYLWLEINQAEHDAEAQYSIVLKQKEKLTMEKPD